MVNIFISLFIAIYSFQAFSLTYQISGINKTFIYMPIAILENSIPLLQENNQKFDAYFDKQLLKINVDSYLKKDLKRYVKNYEVFYYYYDANNNLVCKSDYCDGVKITLKCKIMNLYDYKKSMFYEIKDNTING